MSGHSHFATIKRQKESKDAAKGKIFSKLGRTITLAVKAGGGVTDPNANYKLRMAIDQARASNMPKSNIDRAISNASTGGALDEVTYEGYGPDGVAVIVEAATDNKNRTAQEIKNIFERGGGSLAGPGSVSYNFFSKALIVVQKSGNPEDQMLKLIDLGVEDIEENDQELELYIDPSVASNLKEQIEKNGFIVTSFELIKKPKNMLQISDVDRAKKIFTLLENLDNYDDVQNVYSNIEISDEVGKNL